ncbi:MAG: TolC family protein [Endomicrobium sp.]|jgi:outer membrane protein TolC|nr:TolC family protein [Endomicrobium sp.]
MKKLTALAMLFYAAGVFAQNSPLDLKSAISTALKNNPSVAAAKKNSESAALGASASKGKYLPRIDVTAVAVKMNDPLTLDFNDIRTAIIGASAAAYAGAAGAGANVPAFTQSLGSSIPSFEKKVLDDTFVRLMAVVTQPIFTGFKISANAKVKKLEKTVGEINYENAKNAVITATIEDYYRTKLAASVTEIRKDLQKNIEGHVSNAKKLFNNGIISKANLLKAEVALAEAKKEYQKALMDKELAEVLLTNTLGIKTGMPELSSPMKMIGAGKDCAYFEEKALQNNLSLKLLDAKKEMLEQKHKAAAGNFLPAVAAVGQYQILRDKLTDLEPEWALGLTASVNVFGGGSDFHEIRAAKAGIEAVKSQSENVKDLIYTAVKNFYHRCETAKKDYEALESAQKLAEENLKLYKASFAEGLATSLEVVDSELALTKIKLDREKAVFEYNGAYANLLNVCAAAQEENIGFAPEDTK